MDVARLNGSHRTRAEHAARAIPGCRCGGKFAPSAVLAGCQGPKIRSAGRSSVVCRWGCASVAVRHRRADPADEHWRGPASSNPSAELIRHAAGGNFAPSWSGDRPLRAPRFEIPPARVDPDHGESRRLSSHADILVPLTRDGARVASHGDRTSIFLDPSARFESTFRL
jgi:hypothetical protein